MNARANYLLYATITFLLVLPLSVKGQEQVISDPFINSGTLSIPSLVYYKEVPNRFFIQKSPEIDQEYINSLLDEITNTQFEISWCSKVGYQDYCRIIIDEALIDSIINILFEDDGVLTARRIYVKKETYDKFVDFIKQSGADFFDYLDRILMKYEVWFQNHITCTPVDLKPDLVPKDSICDALGLTYEMEGPTLIKFMIPKESGIFEVSHRLLETGYFISVRPDYLVPYSGMDMDFGDLTGTNADKSDHYFIYSSDGSRKIYYGIPNRLLIQKGPDVTQDYVNSLLNELIDDYYSINWYGEATSEVVVDDVFPDKIIEELLKDEGILFARLVYISKENYEKYLYYPYLEKYEECITNSNIKCWFKEEYDQAQLNNLSAVLGLTVVSNNDTYIVFNAPKNSDIFDILQKLFETGCFKAVNPTITMPNVTWTINSTINVDPIESSYYNVSGVKVNTPTGLTIVVTRYSDGTVRTEKRLF